MTTLSSLSARMMSSDWRNALQSGRFQQLRFSGRLSVIRATPASASRSRMSSGHSFMACQSSAIRSSKMNPGVFMGLRGLRCPDRDFSSIFRYDAGMSKVIDRLSPDEIAAARKRRLEAMHLQVIEGNPLDEEDIAMFEMFEREGWDDKRCLAYIRAQALGTAK